jgi:RHS repeat-associated protein
VTGAAYALDAVTNRTVSYQYDAVGNRQQVTDNGTNTAYTANALNQYSAVGLEAPTYDANGNLTGQSGWAYSYDAQNRLISAVGGSPSVAASFSYDARNRCIKRVINSVTTYLTYDGWSLLEERDAGDNLHAKYIHGATIDEIIVRYNGSPVWYHHDALGSTSALTDGTGAVVESYTYDVYGTVSIFDGSVIGLPTSVFGNRFAFTGREYLADLGLYDYRNRFYSPSLGRFLQTDPIGFSAGDVNLYRYAENSVIAISDPFGLQGGKERITPTYLEGIKDENTVRQILQDKFPNDSTRQKMELKKWQKGNLSRKSSFSGTKLKPKGFGARGVVKGVGYLDILLIILEAIYYESLPDSVPCIEGTGPGTECPCQCPDYYQTYPPYKDCTKVLVGKVVA